MTMLYAVHILHNKIRSFVAFVVIKRLTVASSGAAPQTGVVFSG